MGLRPNFILTCLFLMIAGFGAIAQNSAMASWTVNFEKSKSFIENKGQFKNNDSKNDAPVIFAVDHGSTMIYFTTKGVTYSFLKTWNKEKDEKEEEREEEKKKKIKTAEEWRKMELEENKLEWKKEVVDMFWGNSNPNVEIIAEQETSDYHSYTFKGKDGKDNNVNYIRGFKKITYKNLYPNIDVEYTFHPESGIKYAFILHPGANPDLIQMNYSKKLSLNDKSDLLIATEFGNIIDHAPLSFYKNNTTAIIKSKFVKKGKTVSFKLDNYDNTQTVVIDPWTQSPNFATNWDCIWECERDGTGNVYIIGGVMPLQLIKYNNTGVLQWTYNTPYDTTSWLGTFATDLLGNSYVTQGSVAKILKVNTAGTLVWSNNSPGGVFGSTEFWNIAFNCDQTKLIIGGTGGFVPPLPFVYNVDMATGNMTSSVQVTGGALFPTQEVRAITPSTNGRYYWLSHDSLGYINQNFTLCPGGTNSIFKISNGFALGYKCENWRKNNSGIMAIRANGNFVYTCRGNQVQKRSLLTGAVITTSAIAGGGFASSQVQNAGIDIDACGNVYVGSGNAVIKYDANLNVITSVSTTYRVYDVHVTLGGEVVICGTTGNSGTATRTGTVQVVNMSACAPMTQTCCDATICQPASMCVTAPAITLTVATAGGTFSGPGVNPTTGSFNPSAAGVGTHTIYYSLACGTDSINITVSPCTPLSICQETNGTLTVSNGVAPYTWQVYVPASTTTITNSATCTACGGTWVFGTCLNGAIPITSCTTPAYWSTFATGTNSGTLPASFPTQPIHVTDASGTVLNITTLTGIPACTPTSCPTITVTIPSQTNISCFGQTNGAATVNATGGTGPYTYTWMPGSLSGASQTNLAAGSYTVTATDAASCTGTVTVTITQPASAVSASISSTTPATCGGSNGSATASGSGGTGSLSYSWSPSGGSTATASGLAAGSYTVTVTDANGCTATANTTITNSGGPTVTISSQTNITCFGLTNGAATVNATGGTGPYTYTWMPGSLSGASQTGLAAGTYTVTAADASTCTGTVTVTITQPSSAVSVSITSTTPTNCGASNGAATASASGGTGTITYSWAPSGGSSATANSLAAGTYTVTATDANGCTATATATIANSGGPTVSIASQININCFGGNNGSATASATGGTGTLTYSWSGGAGTSATATNLTAGTYTVTVTDGSGCSNTATVTITQPNAITPTVTTTPATCGLSDGTASVNATGGTGVLTPLWNTGSNNSNITGLAAGTYTVTVTDVNGCTGTATGTVGVSGGIAANAGNNVTITQGESTILNGTGPAGATYSWSPSTGLSCTNCQNPTASPTQTTTYYLTVTQNGCSATDTVTVFVDLPCGELFVPNVFSPNDDGKNDMLYVLGNCITNLEFAIYDRWGEKVFETQSAIYGWDGTYGGKPLDAAVFVYYLSATVNGVEVKQHGNITLIK